MTFGQKLRKIRETNEISMRQLAEQISVSIPMICQLERGTKTVSIQTCQVLAKALGCTLNDLLPDETDTDMDTDTA